MTDIISFSFSISVMDIVLFFFGSLLLIRAFVPQLKFRYDDSIKFQELYFTSFCAIVGTFILSLALFVF